MKIKLFGSLVDETGFKETTIIVEDGIKVIDVLNKVFYKGNKDEASYQKFLILVDGIEAGTLPEGLYSKAKSCSELVIVPISHGG